MSKEQKQAAMRKAEEKYRTGPNGILVYRPQGGEALSPKQLLTQLAVDIVALLAAAWRASAPMMSSGS